MGNLTGIDVGTMYVSNTPSASRKHFSHGGDGRKKKEVYSDRFSIRVHFLGCNN